MPYNVVRKRRGYYIPGLTFRCGEASNYNVGSEVDFGERWEDVGLEDVTAPKLTTKIYP